MADTSPALQISGGGNHSNNVLIIPETKLHVYMVLWQTHTIDVSIEQSVHVGSVSSISRYRDEEVSNTANQKSENVEWWHRSVSTQMKNEIKCCVSTEAPRDPQSAVLCERRFSPNNKKPVLKTLLYSKPDDSG